MKKPLLFSLFFTLVLMFPPRALSKTILHVYGPGGPAPAIKSAATAYMKAHPDVQIQVHAGPTSQWLPEAQQQADLIFSGAEYMMTQFAQQLPQVLPESIYPLYLRPSTLLVRPGNPKKIQGFQDLLKRKLQVLVVDGAGQIGLWEDMAAKPGDIEALRHLRGNLVFSAANSGVAKQYWIDHPEVDAWIIWNHWQVANPNLAEQVEVEPQYRIYRSCGIALTQQGQHTAKGFYDYLKSPEAKHHFNQFGWF